MNLSENVKPFTWVVKVTCNKNGEKTTASLCTGFAINIDKYDFKNRVEENDLVLMTCANSIEKDSIVSIKVRRVVDKNFDLEAKMSSLLAFVLNLLMMVRYQIQHKREEA